MENISGIWLTLLSKATYNKYITMDRCATGNGGTCCHTFIFQGPTEKGSGAASQ